MVPYVQAARANALYDTVSHFKCRQWQELNIEQNGKLLPECLCMCFLCCSEQQTSNLWHRRARLDKREEKPIGTTRYSVRVCTLL